MPNRFLLTSFRPSSMRAVPTFLIFVFTFLYSSGASAYNSEEHKLIVDRGAAMVEIPESLSWPLAVQANEKSAEEYVRIFQFAKNFAAGFATNQPSGPRDPGPTQDRCYRPAALWGQAALNDKIWIPEEGEAPKRVLEIRAEVGTEPAFYTLGELAALYGDYRRTVACAAADQCFLTNRTVDKIEFPRPSSLIPQSDCPSSLDSREYLRYIASGVAPPFGSVGNNMSNAAGDAEVYKAGWWGDEMMRLANVNDNHFANTAIAWYVGMHSRALRAADRARDNPAYWVQALHYEAGALHSLTDLFTIGHAVTNRDRTSYGAIKSRSLETSVTYDWMERLLALGGGKRDKVGAVKLDGDLPPNPDDRSNGRLDFMKSYLSITWASRAKAEHTYHNEFNNHGATVRNLLGNRFEIYGDGKFRDMALPSREVAYQAVRASLQSLIDFYVCRSDNRSWSECNMTSMKALLFLPVFVERDGRGYFQGQWLRYAEAINRIVGARLVPQDWERCEIRYLDGKDWTYPSKPQAACTYFPEP